MSLLDSREAELELIKSMFSVGDELIFQPSSHLDCELPNSYINVTFTLKIDNLAELTVTLPPGYPSGDPSHLVKPIITIRLLDHGTIHSQCERNLCNRFNDWLDEAISSGEPVLYSAIEWLQNELRNEETREQTAAPRDEMAAQASVGHSIVCLWIVSHHIRSPIKRRLIIEWAAELKLGGCCMPGKPGLVVVEGLDNDADEYWRRLRGLQWKSIQMRDREFMCDASSPHTLRFPDGFAEVLLVQHSRFAWLHEKGVSPEQFKLVFGIPGRLPNQDKS